MPLALLRVVSAKWGRRLVSIWKWLAIAALVFILAPFLAAQVQQALYPQLEAVAGERVQEFRMEAPEAYRTETQEAVPQEPSVPLSKSLPAKRKQAAQLDSNLMYEASARIQTGPGVPEWKWRTITLGWNGPVLASQRIHPILISLSFERALDAPRLD